LRLTIRIVFTLFAVLVGFAGASPESWAYLKEPSPPACKQTGDFCPVGITVKFQTPSIPTPSTVRARRIALFQEVAEAAGDSLAEASLQRRYFGLAGTLQGEGTTIRGGVFDVTGTRAGNEALLASRRQLLPLAFAYDPASTHTTRHRFVATNTGIGGAPELGGFRNPDFGNPPRRMFVSQRSTRSSSHGKSDWWALLA
jgi:hypothetical protein